MTASSSAVRAGLRALLDGQDDLGVVGEADSLETALAAVDTMRPDVVLMDLSLGEHTPGGAEVTARLRALSEPAAVLVRRTGQSATSITEREVHVRELLSRGLGQSRHGQGAAVKSHLSHIYIKLGVDTRAGAVAAAIERRIIRPVECSSASDPTLSGTQPRLTHRKPRWLVAESTVCCWRAAGR